jgi:MFS family permease
MIESFGVATNDIAKWTGILASAFSVSQCLTGVPWGLASDRYGRKPVVLLAMACAMISSLLFGFSTNLKLAVLARALSGASNGNIGILRTTVAEMVPQRVLQPKAFAVLPLIWTTGSIIGPVLGGVLASPATNLPEIFGESEFFKKYPFSLPNLVSGVLFTFGMAVGILFLKESLETKKHRRDYGRDVGAWLIRRCRGRRKELRPSDDFESMLPSSQSKAQSTRPPTYSELFQHQTKLTLLSYFILAVHGIAHDQLLPVMMHLPPNNNPVHLPHQFSRGLGLESSRIGLLFMLYGVVGVISQFLIFPALTTKYGALACIRACTFAFPVVYVITPYVVLLPTPLTQQAGVVVIMFLKSLCNVFAYPCITILLTNSAQSLQILGTLNGVATSLAAIGRSVGPLASGRLFTWGVQSGYLVSPFWLLALCAIPGHIVTWWLEEGPGFGDNEEEQKWTEELREDIGLETTAMSQQPGLDLEPAMALFEDSDKDDDSDVEDVPLLTMKHKDYKV